MDGLDPLPLGESFSSVRGVLLTFASVLGSHLCHKSGALYWHVVSMFRACIRLKVSHWRGRAPRVAPAVVIAQSKSRHTGFKCIFIIPHSQLILELPIAIDFP